MSRILIVIAPLVFLAAVAYLFVRNPSRTTVVAPGEYAPPPQYEWPERTKTLDFRPGLDMGSDLVAFTDPDPPKVTCVMKTTCDASPRRW